MSASFQVGAIQVQVIRDGALRLDAQRMFGEERAAVLREQGSLDEAGRFVIGVHCLLVRSGDRIAILDTGLGLSDASPSASNVFEARGQLLPELGRLGVDPAAVDVVVLSHAHTDHIGGVLHQGRPAFPRARYVLGAADFAHYTSPQAQAETSFHARQLVPLQEHGQLEFAEGELEVLPGVRVLPAPGHTPGHLCVGLTSAGEFGLYVGDLVHHPIQVEHPDWSPTIDWLPALSAESRRAMLARARAERALVLTAHLPFPGAGRVAAGWTPGA